MINGIKIQIREIARHRFEQQYFLFEIFKVVKEQAVKVHSGALILQPVRGDKSKFCSNFKFQRNVSRNNIAMAQEILEELFTFSQAVETDDLFKTSYAAHGAIDVNQVIQNMGYASTRGVPNIWYKEYSIVTQ